MSRRRGDDDEADFDPATRAPWDLPAKTAPRDAEADAEAQGVEPRCVACGYLLVGLDGAGVCPECGRRFDLVDRRSVTRLPPFRFLAYWAPAVVGLAALWIGLACLFLVNHSIGWGLTLAVPASVGFVAGYGFRPWARAAIVPGLLGMSVAVGALVTADLVGAFCGFILWVIALVPFAIGLSVGRALAAAMRERPRYTQGRHLPLLVALLLPGVADVAERARGSRPSAESQATTHLLRATPDEAWRALIADDASVGRGALHAVRLTRPLGQQGPRGVGEGSTVRFSKGALRVRVIEREPPRRFAFAYVGQSHVEDRAIRLLDTRFDYASAGPRRTSLTIDTRYDPLMTPRWAWRPLERWAGRTTHAYVARQVQASVDAGRLSPTLPLPVPPGG